MIRITAIAVMMAGIISCNREGGSAFEVSGAIKNSGAKKIYLQETPMGTGQRMILDSAQLGLDGSFHLQAKAKEESLFTLYLDNSVYPLLSLVNDAPKIVVNADLKNDPTPKAEGSAATASLIEFMKTGEQKWNEVNVIGTQLDSLMKAHATDSAIQPLNDKGRALLDNLRNYVSGTIKNAKSPIVAVFPLNDRYYGRLFELQQYDSLITSLEQKFPEHKGIGAIKKAFVDEVMAMQQRQQQQAIPEKWTGKQAPEFTLPDLSGKNVALTSFKGKYVLVDFWASWCGPCRAENPNVVAAYSKFKDKNFTILGVSLDKEKSRWEGAIKEDHLSWAHVSDLKYWESAVVPLYNIEGIPYNVLLDPTGKVIAENLRGPLLEQKLQQVLQ